MMPTYLVFAGYNYYPVGGMDDAVGTFFNIDSARKAAKGKDWYQIVKLVGSGIEVVERG